MESAMATDAARPTDRGPASVAGVPAALVRFCLRHPGRLLAGGGLVVLIGLGIVLGASQGSAMVHLRAARSCLAHYRNAEAVDHLQVCLLAWPRDPESLLLAARAARRAGTHDHALRLLDRYQSFYGSTDEVVLERALVHASRGDLDDVLRYCRARSAANDPAAPLVLEALADGFLRTYRPADADEAVGLWLERQPDNPQAFYYRGLLQEDRSDRLGAVATYRHVLELDPEHDSSRLHLVGLLLDLTQPAELLPHLDYLQRRQPGNVQVQVYLARYWDQMGQPDEARKILDGVLAREPNHAAALAERGRLALRDGEAAAAETYLRQASKLNPGDYQVQYQLSQALTRNGKSEEAQALQVRLKQIEDDLAQISEIVRGKMQQSPHDPDLQCDVGLIALRAGAIPEALRWFQRALRENPRHARTHQALSDYYQQIGEAGRASRHREQAQQARAAAMPRP
jgi:tetratricopeptide (TPR) repeat protein